MRLRTPGQRLPSQSRLITYRIACKSQMLDNEEPNVINMCASAIIEVLKYIGKLSLAKARLASVSALWDFRRSANAKPTTEKRRSTVAEVAGTPRYCRAMRARLGSSLTWFAGAGNCEVAGPGPRPAPRPATRPAPRPTRPRARALPPRMRRRRRPQSGVPCRGDFFGT